MRKLFKWVGIVLGIVVLAIVALIIVLPFLFDPNDFRDEIGLAVKKSTGRELRIAGDLKLTVFPWLGVSVGGVQLSNAPGFGDQPFLRLEGAQVRLNLLALLRKEVEMDRIVVSGLGLNLARNAAGVTNWDDLTAASQAAPSDKPAAAPADTKPEVSLAALAVGGVEVRDATLNWADAQSGAAYRIEHVDLATGPLALGQPVELTLGLDVHSSEPQIDGRLGLRAIIDAAPGFERVAARDVELSVDVRGPTLPGGALAAKLLSQIEADLAGERLSISGLRLDAAGLSVQGEAQVTSFSAPKIQGRLHVPAVNPRELMKRLGMEAPDMADATAMSKLEADLQLDATPDSVRVAPLSVKLDDTSLTGNLAARNFAKPAVRFELAVDAINVDRYLPPTQEAAPATPGEAATGGAAQLPMDTLRGLDVDGSLKIGRLQAFGLHSEQVAMTLKAQGGQIRVYPAGAKLYGGEYAGDIGLDVRQNDPKLAMNERLSGVQIGPLLKDLTGDDKLGGAANIQAKLTAVGIEPAQVRRTLNGTAAVSMTDGAVKGINVAQMLRSANAKLKGQAPPPESAVNQTDFSALSGTFDVRDGVVSNNDLDAKSPLLRVNGGGQADLSKENIDYRLKVAVVGTLKGQGGEDLNDLKGLTVPLRVHGTFTEPKYGLDLDSAFKDRAKEAADAKIAEEKAEIKQKVEEEKQELEQKVQEKLQDKLKGLFR